MNTKPIQRTFIPGSEWVYYKIYSGTTTANNVLTNIVLELTNELLTQNIIKQWFFIRYADPEPHLRVRFLCNNLGQIEDIMILFREKIQYHIDQELVWKLQIDTYQRELERYGKNTMKASEAFFFYDSSMIIEALTLIEDDQLKLFFVLRSIDQLLIDFNLTTIDKLSLVEHNGTSFKKEFNADKKLLKQLDKKYRKYRVAFESFIVIQEHKDYQPLIELIELRSQQLKKDINFIIEAKNKKTLEVSINNLLSSYIHMHINRFFLSRQRLYEMVCYDFLTRYYKNSLGKERAKSLKLSSINY